MANNIIVVDDIEINRFLLKEILKHFKDIIIYEASNGLECIEKINNETCIILMDAMMPVMDGIKAAQHIRLINPNIIIIGVTGQNPMPIHNKVFNHTIYKPYTSQNIINCVKDYLPTT